MQTEYCKKCGIKLFEHIEGTYSGRHIFRSFATRKENGVEYYLCINCHENKNLETFKEKENI